jgi:hypothetical protein
MTPNIITAEKALEALREVVSGKEDHIDPGSVPGGKCLYAIFDEGADRVVPSCIVGTALHSRGVPAGVLASMNRCGSVEEVYSNAEEFDAYFVLTGGAFEVLQAAQTAQDTGRTWGTALEIAEDLWYAIQADEN